MSFVHVISLAAVLATTMITPTYPMRAASLSPAEGKEPAPAKARYRQAAEAGATQGALSRAQLLASASEATFGIVIGNSNGDVTLVEFFDYNCDYCREVAKDVRELVRADRNLRLVLSSFPLHGADSSDAAQVTWAIGRLAGPTGAFQFHAQLMDSRGPVDGQRAFALAAQMGLDATRLRELINDDVGRQATEHNMQLARKLRLTGTPAFIVGGEVVLGATGAARLHSLITNARKCGAMRC